MLFKQDKISIGKARHLAGMNLLQFQHELNLREICVHYDLEELVGLRQKTNREKPQLQFPLGIYFEKPKIAETQIDQGKS